MRSIEESVLPDTFFEISQNFLILLLRIAFHNRSSAAKIKNGLAPLHKFAHGATFGANLHSEHNIMAMQKVE